MCLGSIRREIDEEIYYYAGGDEHFSPSFDSAIRIGSQWRIVVLASRGRGARRTRGSYGLKTS